MIVSAASDKTWLVVVCWAIQWKYFHNQLETWRNTKIWQRETFALCPRISSFI